jgi:hypothetical protein
MRHPNVVRLNPKVGEHLEPHLWTNQIEEEMRQRSSRGNKNNLLFKYSKMQYKQHSQELLEMNKIA